MATIPFGKHRGVELKNLELSYIAWCASFYKDGKWKTLMEEEFVHRGHTLKALQKEMKRLVKDGWFDEEGKQLKTEKIWVTWTDDKRNKGSGSLSEAVGSIIPDCPDS